VVLHFAYQLTLITAYRHGDLSHVYPIARGVAPLGVALVGALVLGEAPGGWQLAGLVAASAAIGSLAFGGSDAVPGRAVLYALLTGFWISVYTVVDGAGARIAENALSFAAWALALDAVPIGLFAFVRRRGRLIAALLKEGPRYVAGGVISVIGYGIVLWAFTREALWGVAALRETSVVFAALIGSRLLREPFGRRRTVAAVALALGLVALRV
jgi:drug/metabolite transporter (DMT)-like permease